MPASPWILAGVLPTSQASTRSRGGLSQLASVASSASLLSLVCGGAESAVTFSRPAWTVCVAFPGLAQPAALGESHSAVLWDHGDGLRLPALC